MILSRWTPKPPVLVDFIAVMKMGITGRRPLADLHADPRTYTMPISGGRPHAMLLIDLKSRACIDVKDDGPGPGFRMTNQAVKKRSNLNVARVNSRLGLVSVRGMSCAFSLWLVVDRATFDRSGDGPPARRPSPLLLTPPPTPFFPNLAGSAWGGRRDHRPSAMAVSSEPPARERPASTVFVSWRLRERDPPLRVSLPRRAASGMPF